MKENFKVSQYKFSFATMNNNQQDEKPPEGEKDAEEEIQEEEEDETDYAVYQEDADDDFGLLEADDNDEVKMITKIFQHCSKGNLEQLELLSQRNNYKRFRKWLKSHDDQYNIPFHYAAMNGHQEILEFLHKHFKISPDEKGQNKMIALHFAARYGKVCSEAADDEDKTWKTVDYLLKIGGDGLG